MNNTVFKKQLKKLLKQHKISIHFNCSPCSDTYGLYDERIELVDEKNKTIAKSYGWYLDANDL